VCKHVWISQGFCTVTVEHKATAHAQANALPSQGLQNKFYVRNVVESATRGALQS
jgi:hypothetical protein